MKNACKIHSIADSLSGITPLSQAVRVKVADGAELTSLFLLPRNARSMDGVIPPPPPANEQVLSFIDLLRLTKLWSNARL